jgi:hypothetical protein
MLLRRQEGKYKVAAGWAAASPVPRFAHIGLTI